jgi:hypothetical protein
VNAGERTQVELVARVLAVGNWDVESEQRREAFRIGARAILAALDAEGHLYRGENAAAAALLEVVRPALRDLPTSCRYHGTAFDFLGREANDEPRCDSCKPAYRATRALTAVERWYTGVSGSAFGSRARGCRRDSRSR